MITTKVKLKVLRDQPCYVLNYRRKPAIWEPATVQWVTAGFDAEGTARVSYQVMLERRTTGRSRFYPDGGAPMFLTVGDDGIKPRK